MALEFTTSYLEDSLSLFHYYKGLSERAMTQLSDEQLFAILDEEMNSIAVIAKHMTGNMRSRWTGFPDLDGEKPGRDRDAEFADPPDSREALDAHLGRRLELFVCGTGTAVRCRHGTNHHHSRRKAFHHAVHQSPGGALCLSLRSDCLSRQASAE